ncbi:hypothetical protein H5T88_06305 [bacterium]|nr:hypothetical protein [bacterium]
MEYKVNLVDMKRGNFYLRRDLKGEDIVKFRLEVMEFSDKYGVEAAKKVFGVSISTIFKKS